MSLFGDINEVKVMGNMTAVPELRFTNSGLPVANFSVATNRRYKKGEEWLDETEFHNVVLFGNQASQFVPRVQKGTRVMVTGRLQTRSWDDKQTGKKNYRTEIIANDVFLIDRYERGKVDPATQENAEQYAGGGNTGNGSVGNSGAANTNSSANSAGGNNSGYKGGDDVIDPDDLPF